MLSTSHRGYNSFTPQNSFILRTENGMIFFMPFFVYIMPDIFAVPAMIKQMMLPNTKGSNIEIPAHFQLPASFFIVRQVVEHGQCINENNIVHNAVTHVQPLSVSICRSSVKLA